MAPKWYEFNIVFQADLDPDKLNNHLKLVERFSKMIDVDEMWVHDITLREMK